MFDLNKVGLVKDVKLEMQGLFGKINRQEEGLILVGKIFFGDVLATPNQLHEILTEAISQGRLSEVAKNLNGFFQIIFRHEDRLYIISDKLRSMPVFYTNIDGILYVSDSVDFLRKKIKNIEADEVSVEEFLMTGYVTGRDTLIKNLFQIQSSEILVFGEQTHQSIIYYGFYPQNPPITDFSEDYWMEQIDEALKGAIQRLIKLANGRQIVIPLSGGYDSRAIAICLKEAGYSNLLAFTFGRKNSPEVAISKKVAEALNIEWKCVEYTWNTWSGMKEHDWFIDYVKLINSAVSVPNIQVVPAIKVLSETAIIKRDAIIVPGHTGDFVAGKQMLLSYMDAVDESSLIDRLQMGVVNRHYRLIKNKELSESLDEKIKNNLKIVCEGLHDELGAKQKFLCITEAWNQKERQTKFIGNSNRYYDFFKLEWHMPFWDNDFLRVWEEVPLEYRIDEKLWIGLVSNKYKKYSNEDVDHLMRNEFLLQKAFKNVFNYYFDMNYLYRIVPFWRWFLYRFKLSNKTGTLFGYLSEFTLSTLLLNH